MKRITNQPDPRVSQILQEGLDRQLYLKAEEIRQWLLDTPGVSEAVKYKVPFYDYFGPLIYFNPKGDQLIVGFTKGIYIEDPFGLLTGDQKQIRHFLVNSDTDISENLPFYIDEALQLNKKLKKK